VTILFLSICGSSCTGKIKLLGLEESEVREKIRNNFVVALIENNPGSFYGQKIIKKFFSNMNLG
jgi:hypothetical protein